MILFKTMFVLLAVSMIDAIMYLYHTIDGSSVEFYDCILHKSVFYCRRPREPIRLNRDNDTRGCYHGGQRYSFADLYRDNVSASTILHGWKSSMENAGRYMRYTQGRGEKEGYICNCTDAQAFGKNCEYRLPSGTTFEETLNWETALKASNSNYSQLYGDVICYETFQCNSGLLCLDWRDICDGVQQCMSGIDEDMCDKLEFNECERDEYRCRNGMCIPEEYFLDGDFDCLDWSDEIQYYDDRSCVIGGASVRCDDRFCPPRKYSCGDGQCVSQRFTFEFIAPLMPRDCHSRREHYFFCESNMLRRMWTLSNGRCYEGSDYEEVNVTNGTEAERCEYLLRCWLSRGIEKNCPCDQSFSCTFQLNEICSTYYIQYPRAGIFAPYILSLYSTTRTPLPLGPDYILINGTFRCGGNLISVNGVNRTSWPTWNKMEEVVCSLTREDYIDLNETYLRHPFTFDNHSYNSIDACNQPKKAISTYRIADGSIDCGDAADESGNFSALSTCTKFQKHRFRCSTDEKKYLNIIHLGDSKDNCENKYDEVWFGFNVQLVDISCNDKEKDECARLRQYIEDSWTLNITNQMAQQSRIPFRYYCDTFWNLGQHKDENIDHCQQWWRCSEEQWQCDTGQCIESEWVLDGEWDCVDASDEDEPHHRYFSPRNLQIIPRSTLENRYTILLKKCPLCTMCNETSEFHCLPLNLSRTIDRPCLSRNHIGDNHIDCYGAIDERQTIAHCTQPTMLGNSFRCPSSNQCIQYRSFCASNRCATESDEQFWCSRQSNRSDCSSPISAVCFNGTCIKYSRCNGILECPFGEDEYMCDYGITTPNNDAPYRVKKQFFVKDVKRKLRLNRFPASSAFTEIISDTNSTTQASITTTPSTDNITAPIAYRCNRGVGIYEPNESIACFCPPQYYGDKCQYHNDRIPLLIHLDLSQSIYNRNSDINIAFKLLVLFLFNNETLMNDVFHVRPATEEFVYSKKSVHLLYSRASQYLQHKRGRSRNQSSIIHDHPYSIRIELYQRMPSGNPHFIAVWQYPIYFDYLPVFRFAKVLRFSGPKPCSRNPCHPNEDCHQLINDPSKHICLCKSHFGGENCSVEDSYCHNGFCANGSICKPNYRGILLGNEFPLCICPFERFGDRCYLGRDVCAYTRCLNNGSCFHTSVANNVICECTEEYYGDRCEKTKAVVKLYFNQTLSYAVATIQYFHINFVSLDLMHSHQRIYRDLPPLIEYRHKGETIPELILLKAYLTSIDTLPTIYLLSTHLNATDISATVQINEESRCSHVKTWMIPQSPIQYHFLCQNNTDLLCFRDDVYLCLCAENHTRVECFLYDSQLDQCSRCLAGGRCLQADQKQPADFLCLCPRCYSGKYCQFNFNSFVFTLEQLFLSDLQSTQQTRAICLLIIIPCFFAFFALLNNLFSFVTFRRPKCSNTGIGQCLLVLSIINQLNLTILVVRLIHLSLTITGLSSHSNLDDFLCKILNYLLSSLMRIVYWLVSFISTERVYTVIFLKGQWLNKTSVARCLIVFIIVIVGGSTGYELLFIRSFVFEDETMKKMCVIDFPSHSRDQWILVHKIVSITHSTLPLVINLGCTIAMIYIITRTKLNIHRPTQCSNTIETTGETNPTKANEGRSRLYQIRNVLADNKEIIARPTITLIPSIFSLFSLPFLIISFSLGCADLDQNNMRYVMIVFYFLSFVPQIITFLVYVYPSSLYFNEWRLTKLGQWIMSPRQTPAAQHSMIYSGPETRHD